ARQYSYGLNAVSDHLFDFWDQTLRSLDPEAPELVSLVGERQTQFGVLAGGRIAANDISLWFSAKGARTLGGLTASRQRGDVEEVGKQVQGATSEDEGDDDIDDSGTSEAQESLETQETQDGQEGTARQGASKKDTPKDHPFSHYWKKQRKAPA